MKKSLLHAGVVTRLLVLPLFAQQELYVELHSNGELTFEAIPEASSYRVEWASNPDGVWTNFQAAASLDNIAGDGLTGIVTLQVPLMYRVVATIPPNPYDCDVLVVADVTCSSDIFDSTTVGGSTVLNGYPDVPPFSGVGDQQTGPEAVFLFSAQATGTVTVYLDNMTEDLDLYVLEGDCNPASTIDGNNEPNGGANPTSTSVAFEVTEGVAYFIVVESFNTVGGVFDLYLDDNTGGCREDCDDGVDNDRDGLIDCDDPDCLATPECP